jgi:uncharacterized protein YukE
MPGGDPVGLRAAARRSGTTAAELRRVASVLASSAETARWSGPGQRAFAEQVRAHTPSMSATADRYERYAGALHAYAGALEQTTPGLLAARHRLRARYEQLTSQPGHPDQAALGFAAGGGFGFGPGTCPGAESADLLPIAYDFKAGFDRWAQALDRCIQALTDADEADPTRDPRGLGAFAGRLAATAKGHLSPFAKAMTNPTLANLSDCASVLSADLTVLGLGLLLICPPAAAACLAAATVLALAQLALDTTRRARGEQISNTHLGLRLAAAIPIGGPALRGLRATDSLVHLVPGGGLMAHEGLDGGHTLAKHVGKTEHYLRDRLATEPNLYAASTFHDRQIAENSLSQLLQVNAHGVERWLAGGSRSLVLRGRMSDPVGIAVLRDAAGPVEASGIRLVLKRSTSTTTGYRIHTAMVEL